MFDMTDIIITVSFMFAMGLVLSTLLAVANRKFWVYEDPRIDAVEEMLPNTNCGACGTAGCRVFAESLITGDVSPSNCTVIPIEATTEIADFLGVDAGDTVKRVARLACAGGTNVARSFAHYQGMETCRAASLIAGGPKNCSWGCIGLADCANVCDQQAISMNKYNLPVVDASKCTACDDCVDVCPKNLFSLQPITHKLWVSCKSLEHGDAALAECSVACDGCERCVADSPDGLISMQNNLPVINYDNNQLASKQITERCPTGAIVWLDNEKLLKGKSAKRIVRQEALPVRQI